MEAKIQLSNLVYATLKKFSESKRKEVIKDIYVYVALNNGRIMRYGDGFVVTYDAAKQLVKKLHLHCSRFFSETELPNLVAGGVMTQEQFDALTA